MAKRVKATLYISEDKREKIRRSGLSLEAYFNRLWEKHDRFCMDRWREGGFWIKDFRVCLIRAEAINFILDNLEEDSLGKIGREAGEKLRSTMEVGYDFRLDDESKSKMVEYLNEFSGWGNFTLRKDAIIIKTPVFNKPHFIKGYLEGLFNLSLTLIESYPDRMAFKISH